jgi:aryl-alcohol dehydrogenase-like predicted oxidoreductase
MNTRPIPHTDLTASVLCLGTAEFGSAVDESSSEKLIDTYLDAGGNVLDTAEIYGMLICSILSKPQTRRSAGRISHF